jgi:hypothetical protein
MKTYFLERCSGGTKSGDFWKTIKPFFSKKGSSGEQKIVLSLFYLQEKNNIDCHNVYFGNPDNIVTDVEMHCHLGLDFQNNCKWKNHITKIYEKACDRLKIRRMLINSPISRPIIYSTKVC